MLQPPSARRAAPTLHAFLLAFIVAGSGMLAAAPAHAREPGAGGALAVLQWLPVVRFLGTAVPGMGGFLDSLGASDAISNGGDGRLTVMLLGSDYRPTLAGDRTDAVLVMTINPKTKQVAALSIPRDVARLPLPNGTIYNGRVNTLYAHYKKGRTRAQAMAQVEKVLEHVLKIEIDYHAYIRFNGFNRLIDHVAGVNVRIPSEIKDPKFWDDPKKPQGVYFPASASWLVKGNTTLCNGLYKTRAYTGQAGYRCQRALIYARSRKGAGNSDFKRAQRHQDLTFSAVTKVRQRGRSNLGALVNALVGQQSAGDFYTNIPLNLAHAETLFNLAAGAYMDRQVVLKPTKYATRITGTSTYQLRLAEVRALTKSWFARVP